MRSRGPDGLTLALRLLHHQRGTVRPHDTDLRAGGRARAGDAPRRVVDADAAAALDDRRLQGEDASDEGVAATVEGGWTRILLFRVARHRAAEEHGRHREDRKADRGRLPAEIESPVEHAGRDRREPEP